jgi:hypothetical protein
MICPKLKLEIKVNKQIYKIGLIVKDFNFIIATNVWALNTTKADALKSTTNAGFVVF